MMTQEPSTSQAVDVSWILPGHHGSPAQALSRIEAICAGMPDLFSAMLAVLATHQGVPREILATAVLHFRPDAHDLTKEAVTGLLISIVQGGRPGFEAVLRAKRKGDRKMIALPFVKD